MDYKYEAARQMPENKDKSDELKEKKKKQKKKEEEGRESGGKEK